MVKRASSPRSFWYGLASITLGLSVVLLFLFHESLNPDKVLFSNDNPLGAIHAAWWELPQTFFGSWQDLSWLGINYKTQLLMSYNILRLVLGTLLFAKFYTPCALLFLGVSAWILFRTLKLSPAACVLGALATALNSGYFSTACWGVGSQEVCIGFNMLALAALVSHADQRSWAKIILAGFAVGMGIMEGLDIGAIFSLLVAAFAVFQALFMEGPLLTKVFKGATRVAMIALFAAIIAIQALSSLISTQIMGVSGMEQDTQSKAQRWGEATRWSLPKREVVQFVVPGIYGYRMDTEDGGNYWGAMGRDPAWDRYFKILGGGRLQEGDVLQFAFSGATNFQQIKEDGKITLPSLGEAKAAGLTVSDFQKEAEKQYSARSQGVAVAPLTPTGMLRFSGGGAYSGVMVVLVAIWAAIQGFRKTDLIYTPSQRNFMRFWFVVAVGALLLAFGRFAPFYKIFYAFPYASTIRNPAKFINVFNFALLVLFAYGVHGLIRRYMETTVANFRGAALQSKQWWAAASEFDKRWIVGSIGVVVAALFVWFTYSASQTRLESSLKTVGFNDEVLAHQIASFSIKEVGRSVLFLALSAGAVISILGGAFNGARAKWGKILLGAILLCDLGLANQPWIVHWNYKQKYASNPIIDLLRQKPYEQRVIMLPFRAPPQLSLFSTLYGIEWSQHHFLYYNIQSLSVIQLPRPPIDMETYERALYCPGTPESLYLFPRRWQLTNTRYFLGPIVTRLPMGDVDTLSFLNDGLDAAHKRFRTAQRFNIGPKPGFSEARHLDELTAVTDPNGQYALFEFTGALPRAKLYSNWQVNTNDTETLAQLTAPSFDPAQTVLVANPLPPSDAAAATNQNAGSVEIREYAPRRVVLQANANVPSILLLNDKFDPDWKVTVDGKPQTLLRCNYIVRGVQLSPGEHKVEFQYVTSTKTFYGSLSAIALGVVLVVYVSFGKKPEEVEKSKTKAGAFAK